MKVGYLAVKKANPNAVVSFPGTSYWVDVNSNRALFYDRVLAILAHDPNAAANNFYHDVVSLNLYRAPDDVYRVYGVFKDIQKKYGVDKPRLADRDQRHAVRRQRHPVRRQARQRSNQDHDGPAGGVRDPGAGAGRGRWLRQDRVLPDGRRQHLRPARRVGRDPRRRHAAAGQRRAQGRRQQLRGLHQRPVRAAHPRDRRVVGLARGSRLAGPQLAGLPGRLRQARQPARHRALERRRLSATRPHQEERLERTAWSIARATAHHLQDNQGWWVLDLPAATAYFKVNDQIKDPEGYHFIGGDPLLVVEDGVDPSTPRRRAGARRSGQRCTRLQGLRQPRRRPDRRRAATPPTSSPAPAATKASRDPIAFSVVQWSTQRFPDPKDGSSLPLAVHCPRPSSQATPPRSTSKPRAPIRASITSRVEAAGGGISKTFDLALVLN